MNGPTRALPDGEGTAELSQLELGAWVGRYQVEALLGRGGMGAVYQVRDSVLERSVALKAIRFGEAGDTVMLDRFRREAKALAQLNHPNVCQVHDWVEWAGGVFIAMELVEGQTLAEAGPSMARTAKLQALRAIASALEAAHAKGIVHRDLKPINIMVDGEQRVKVLDFGLARLLEPGDPGTTGGQAAPGQPWLFPEEAGMTSFQLPESDPATLLAVTDSVNQVPLSQHPSLTQAGAFMGSPGHASPEQIARLPVGPPSDIFSLGILAWELLLGEHPFPGKGAERMNATLAGKRRSLQGRKLHPRLKALLRQMLARNPSARPSAHRVLETLNRQLQPFPTAAWIALGAAALFLLLGLGYVFHGRSIVADLIKDRPPRLAVLPIRNNTGEPALASLAEVGMTELLATALRESPNLRVVDGEAVARALGALRLDPGRPLEAQQLAQVLQAVGAPLVLQGSLERDTVSGALRFAYTLRTRAGATRYSGRVVLPTGSPATAYALIDPAAVDLLKKVDPLGKASSRGPAPPAEAFAAYSLGKALFLKGDFQGSEALLKEAAFKAPAFSQAVTAYASCLRRLGRDQATAVTNWAIMAARATGDHWAEGRALGVKAFLARDRGDLQEAEMLRRATLALAESMRDADGAAVATNHLGLIAAERGQDALAQSYYEQSLALARQVADQSYITLAQNNMANLALKRGDLQGASERYKEVLASQGSMGNLFGQALVLNNLGVVALTANNLADAERYLGKALAIRESVGDKAGRATSLRNLGILALMKGNPDQAQSLYQQSLAYAMESGIRAIEAESRFYLGDLYRMRQRFRPAQEEYRQTLERLPGGVTPMFRAGAQAGLAECEARLTPARLGAARRQLEAIGPEHQNTPYTLRAWAWVQFLSGNNSLALATLDRAKADPKRDAPEIQRELTDLRGQWLPNRVGQTP